VSASKYTKDLTVIGAKDDLLDMLVVTGTGNDSLSTGVSALAATLTGGTGADTFTIEGDTADANVEDLGNGSDILIVKSSAGGVDVKVTKDFTATAASTQSNTDATDVKLTSQSAGVDIDMSSAGGPFGYHLVAFADGVKLTGSAFGDSLQGAAGIDTIVGNAGTDTITAGGGADVINAGSGTNSMTDAGDGADAITHNSASSTMTLAVTGTGVVALTATTAGATANGANGANRTVNATNSTAAVALNGGNGADTLTGGSGADTITGKATGIDSITGGTGADIFVFADTADSPGSVAANTTNTADFITDFATVDKFNLNAVGDGGGGGVGVDFTAAATATVAKATIDAVANYGAIDAALETALSAVVAASTTTSAKVYDVTLTGSGLAAAGITRLMIITDGVAAAAATDMYVNLQAGAPDLAAGNFTFTA
jgi:hypothetical protein